jgi:nitrogen fixation-related uncharacterized protein
MNAHQSVSQELVKGAGRFVVHALALVVGMIFMVAGIAMGVTIAMLPIGIPLGLVGLILFFWGLFGGAEGNVPPAQPPAPSPPLK